MTHTLQASTAALVILLAASSVEAQDNSPLCRHGVPNLAPTESVELEGGGRLTIFGAGDVEDADCPFEDLDALRVQIRTHEREEVGFVFGTLWDLFHGAPETDYYQCLTAVSHWIKRNEAHASFCLDDSAEQFELKLRPDGKWHVRALHIADWTHSGKCLASVRGENIYGHVLGFESCDYLDPAQAVEFISTGSDADSYFIRVNGLWLRTSYDQPGAYVMGALTGETALVSSVNPSILSRFTWSVARSGSNHARNLRDVIGPDAYPDEDGDRCLDRFDLESGASSPRLCGGCTLGCPGEGVCYAVSSRNPGSPRDELCAYGSDDGLPLPADQALHFSQSKRGGQLLLFRATDLEERPPLPDPGGGGCAEATALSTLGFGAVIHLASMRRRRRRRLL